MTASLITTAINIGAEVFKAAEGVIGAKADSYIQAGSAIVSAAVNLYGDVKDTLSATDVATIDQAVEDAHAKCGTDLARVLAELDAASAV